MSGHLWPRRWKNFQKSHRARLVWRERRRGGSGELLKIPTCVSPVYQGLFFQAAAA